MACLWISSSAPGLQSYHSCWARCESYSNTLSACMVVQILHCTTFRDSILFLFSHLDPQTLINDSTPVVLKYPSSSFQPLPCWPVKPEGQTQRKAPGRSRQLAPVGHGPLRHSSTSSWQRGPSKPMVQQGNQGPSWKSAHVPTVTSSVFEPQFTWGTLAMEGSRLVLALPAIGTGRALTFVDVLLTPGASETWRGGEWVGRDDQGLIFFFYFL